jgi:hypothetical protein
MTLGRVVELRKPQAAGSQSIKMRCLDLTAITAEIGKAHVVDMNAQQVRATGLCL